MKRTFYHEQQERRRDVRREEFAEHRLKHRPFSEYSHTRSMEKLTIDNTVIDSHGRDVEYTSGGGCSALGIGGRSGLGDDTLALSSPSPPGFARRHLSTKLGLCFNAFEKDTRPEKRRGWEGCGDAASERAGEASASSNADKSVLRPGTARFCVELGPLIDATVVGGVLVLLRGRRGGEVGKRNKYSRAPDTAPASYLICFGKVTSKYSSGREAAVTSRFSEATEVLSRVRNRDQYSELFVRSYLHRS